MIKSFNNKVLLFKGDFFCIGKKSGSRKTESPEVKPNLNLPAAPSAIRRGGGRWSFGLFKRMLAITI